MRPLEQSVQAASRDVSVLTRVLQRVTEDVDHRLEERIEIAGHIRSAITGLMKWTESVAPKKNGHKEKPVAQNHRSRAER